MGVLRCFWFLFPAFIEYNPKTNYMILLANPRTTHTHISSKSSAQCTSNRWIGLLPRQFPVDPFCACKSGWCFMPNGFPQRLELAISFYFCQVAIPRGGFLGDFGWHWGLRSGEFLFWDWARWSFWRRNLLDLLHFDAIFQKSSAPPKHSPKQLPVCGFLRVLKMPKDIEEQARQLCIQHSFSTPDDATERRMERTRWK